MVGLVLAINKLSISSDLVMIPKRSIPEDAVGTTEHPLRIEEMRNKSYPGSDLEIEEELSSGLNYKQYVASYNSDDLKVYGLLTVPEGNRPSDGWPVIIFNHGYIPPEQYRTTERYVSYVDGFARNGYIVFKPDYRGHGISEGKPEGAYFSTAYTVDVLNAISSIKRYKDANPEKIGMWGHSMGGNITQRVMVIKRDVKAGVIWSGVVGSYDDMFRLWWNRRTNTFQPSEREMQARRTTRQTFLEKYGSPSANPKFWDSISPTSFLKDLSGPLQLHHGTADETVPLGLSESFYDELRDTGKQAELFIYQGADHNLSSPAFELAMERSVRFFDKYLK